MKKYIIKLSYIWLLLGVMTSCMDLDPLDSMGDNITWSSSDNFQLFANQFYAYTRDFNQSGEHNAYNGFSDGPHSDFRSDLIATSSINTFSQGTNTIPTEDDNYSVTYKRIYYTNLLLENAKSYSNESEIEIPVAEAKFFRAYLHFELVQLYGDVILLTKPLDIDSDELSGKRDDRGVVIDQIITDLEDAALALPVTVTEEGRLTQAAAYAFLSRVALYEGTWQKFHNSNTARSTDLLTTARDAAMNVMDGTYELFYDETLDIDSYRYMFILEHTQCNPAGLTISDNKEYILAHRHFDGDKLGTNITHAALGNVIYPTSKFVNMYLCSNGLPVSVSDLFGGYSTATTEFQNRDNRMATSLIKHGTKYWNNDGAWRTSWNDDDLENCLTMDVRSNGGYQNQKWATERQVADEYESYDYPVIRYAEILLNYAEAVYELNGAITDEQLDASLNLVRLRVNPNMPKLSNSFVSTNSLDMREEIRRERTIELYLEGFRIDDLKRWAVAGDEMPEDQLGVMFTGTWFETNWTKQARGINSDGRVILYDNRTWADKNYLYPLPSDELQLNPNLGQNTGWE